MPYDQIIGTKANEIDPLTGSIPDDQLILVPNPVTGELLRSTFGQMKADIILAFGGISYLDPIVEVATVADLPQPGAIKTLYVITTGDDANTQWRWGGSMYIEFPHGGDADVAGEAAIRGNADTILQANIDAEATAREAADDDLQTNITAEATSRANADTTLQSNINAEANTRSNNDTTLASLINSEATSRANADNSLSARIDAKLDAADYNQHFKGKYTSLSALQAALTTGTPGDYAQVDAGAGTDVINYNWDDEDGWIKGGSGSSATTTDELPEGATNKYFTVARVLATLLTGLSVATGGDIVSTDSVLAAFGKIQKRFNDLLTTFNGANQLVKLDADAKLPAVDGSQLTNLPASGGGGSYYGTATGTNTYAATITGITAYTAGVAIEIKFTNANTGASTININTLGALSIVKNGSAALAAGDIPAGAILTLSYDGSNMQIVGSINALPVVTSGEKAVTVKNDGAHSDYDVLDVFSATSTTGAQLEAMDWSAGSVTKTGKTGEVRNYNGYKYECYSSNTWWRTPFNLVVDDYVMGSIADSDAIKTSAQMADLYPSAGVAQIVKGTNGIYQYFTTGWMYFKNEIST